MDEQLSNERASTLTQTKPSAQRSPGVLAILPLRNSVLFPYTVMPLTIGRPSSLLLELRQKIRAETKESVDKAQRDYFLREQLKAIKKELGEEDGKNVEIEELRQKIAALKAPPEVEKEALRELSRLERMSEMSAERNGRRITG